MVDLMSPVSLAERPSYDAACKLVPPEYLIAWDWFLREEQRAAHWRNLPHRTRKDDPQFPYRPQEFPITRDSGIFSIGLEHLSNKPKIDFALSVHNSKRSAYIDVPPLYLNDGTWLLKYSAHVRGGGNGTLSALQRETVQLHETRRSRWRPFYRGHQLPRYGSRFC